MHNLLRRYLRPDGCFPPAVETLGKLMANPLYLTPVTLIISPVIIHGREAWLFINRVLTLNNGEVGNLGRASSMVTTDVGATLAVELLAEAWELAVPF
jgi:hypothetical protein